METSASASSAFNWRLVAILFGASGVMVPLGLGLRPVHLQWFDTSHFPTIAASMQTWIWSFRILVFGFFLRVGALSALSAFSWRDDVKPLLQAGVTICVLGCLVSALGSGYYMDTGVWGSWEVTQRVGVEAQATLVNELRPVNAWGECLIRMGSVFFCLGSIFVGAALLRARFLTPLLGWFPIAYGLVGICVGMFMANDVAATLAVMVVHALWCLGMAIAMRTPS